MSDKILHITDANKALKFIRKASCDRNVANSVTISPTSLEDLSQAEARALLAEHGMSVADGMNVRFVVDTADTMHIRIPHFGRVQKYPSGETDPVDGAVPGPGGETLPSQMSDYEYQHAELEDIYKEA